MLAEVGLVPWMASVLLLSLRIGTVFTFAPPFSLVRIPSIFRLLFGLGLSAAVLAIQPRELFVTDLRLGSLVAMAFGELLIGFTFVLSLQIVYATLYMAGRLIDIQAGYGLAAVIDPQTRANLPLVGSLFAYAFGMIFFATGGDIELLRILAGSLQVIPLGQGHGLAGITQLGQYMSVVFITGLAVGAAAVLALFVADLGVAFLTRAAPQMNALVFGFQAKTLLLLLVLPGAMGLSTSAFARLARLGLEGATRLL